MFFVCLGGVRSFAVEETQTVVLELTYCAVPATTSIFERIISRTAVFELERTGFAVVSVTHLKKKLISLTRDQETINLDQLFAMAGDFQARFVLLAQYEESADAVKVDFKWYDAAGATLVRTAAVSRPKRVSLDTYLTQSLKTILSVADTRTVRSYPLYSREKPAGPAEKIPTAPVETARPPLPEVPAAESEAVCPVFTAYAGAAPFLTVGDAADYFKVGVMPGLILNFNIPLGGTYLGLGIYAGANYFTARGGTGDFDNLVVPLGIDIHFGAVDNTPVGWFVRASGGMALFTLEVSTAPQTKAVAFAAAGVGLQIPLFAGLGLALEGNFIAFFEGASPIMGFSPHGYIVVSL